MSGCGHDFHDGRGKNRVGRDPDTKAWTPCLRGRVCPVTWGDKTCHLPEGHDGLHGDAAWVTGRKPTHDYDPQAGTTKGACGVCGEAVQQHDAGREATPEIHEPGEYVPGLGWSCLTCDTFGCVGVDHKFLPDLAGALVHQDCWCGHA